MPALIAGNAVILKHAAQTILVGERFQQAFDRGGPAERPVHASRAQRMSDTARMLCRGRRRPCEFHRLGRRRQGDRAGGGRHASRASASSSAARTRPMCARTPISTHAVENLVDGAFFNSGQCCCGIERIYVHEALYDRFVEAFAELTRRYVLGNPLDAGDDARADGASALRRSRAPPDRRGAREGRARPHRRARPSRRMPTGTPYLAPQVLTERRSPDERDDRGELRPRGRHHEGEVRRGGDRADERQPVWPDRLDLDERHGRGRSASATGSRPAPSS